MQITTNVHYVDAAKAATQDYGDFATVKIYATEGWGWGVTLFFQSENQGENIRKANMIADIINGDA